MTVITIAAALIALMVIVGQCLGQPRQIDGQNSQSPKEYATADSDCRVKTFEYRHSSSISSGCYFVAASRKDGKASLTFEAAGKRPKKFAVDEVFMQSLDSICCRHGIMGWDGFHEVDPYCLDGWSFYLNAAFEDGSVSASGQNRAPSGFRGFADDLADLCKPYFRLEP